MTNGGYVSVYNREVNNRIDRYIVTGKTKTNIFEVGFDTKSPEHCITRTPACTIQPLVVPDVSTEVSIIVLNRLNLSRNVTNRTF